MKKTESLKNSGTSRWFGQELGKIFLPILLFLFLVFPLAGFEEQELIGILKKINSTDDYVWRAEWLESTDHLF